METELLKQCRDKYNLLIKTIHDFDNDLSLETKVRQLFKLVNGIVYFKSKTATYVAYDGRVEDYTIGGSVSKNYMIPDLNRLAEDLTMGFYKANGGKQKSYIPQFISELKALDG